MTTKKRPNVTKTAIRRALKLLGDTPDKIAASLGRRRIKGYAARCHECPLACYLRRHFGVPGLYGVAVGDRIRVGGCSTPASYPIRAFIANFDDSKYPKLLTK